MHHAHHTAGCRCIHEPCLCEKLHQFLGSPWAWSAIWREWKHRHWEESKISKREQLSNQQDVSYATKYRNNHWQSTYFKIFWKSWHWSSYSTEYLLYWLRWHLVVDTSSLTVKKTKSLSTTTYYVGEYMVECDTGVACVSLSILSIHLWVAQESKIPWLPPTLHITGCMDHFQVHHGHCQAILLLDPVNVEEV